MPIALILISLTVFIVLISVLKLDTFIAFILVSIGLGLASNLGVTQIVKSIQSGIGNTLGDLVLIIGFGAMLGKIVEVSGAAHVITEKLLLTFKGKNIVWGLALAGFIIGIPIFYNAGFILVVPIIYSIAQKSKLPILFLAIPILSSLSVSHGFLPPHPSPTAISSLLGANIGKTLIYGLIVSIPSIIVAGPVFAQTLLKYKTPNIEFFASKLDIKKTPSAFLSFVIALLPVILLAIMVLLSKILPSNTLIQLLSQPFMAMLIALLVAIYLLGIRQGISSDEIRIHLENAFKSIAPLLLVLAGTGAFKQIIIDNGSSAYLGDKLSHLALNPLILGWLIAAIIRVCLGSATIAGLTTAGLLLPLISQNAAISKELMVLSIGAGSLMFSHLNDSGFWLFKEYFNLSIKQTLRTWSLMETLVSITGLFAILILNQCI